MMNVEVLLFGKLRELAPRQQITSMTASAKLTDLIECLAKEYGGDFRQEVSHMERLCILINGQEYDLLGGMQTPLRDGDSIVFLPIIAGG